MDKKLVYLMFYPIEWGRHYFDYLSDHNIIETVKKFGVEYVKFIPWGTLTNEAHYDADLFNDWDDDADDYIIKECENIVKDNKLNFGKNFDKDYIFNHWCLPVSGDIKNGIQKINQ